MNIPGENQQNGAFWLPILARLPVVSGCAKTRGWHYALSWLHRLTGIGLVIYLTVHIYNLASLQPPAIGSFQLLTNAGPVYMLIAWLSSLFVGFHAVNGGRLILYELFGMRNDATMLRWTFGLVFSYAAMVWFVMIMQNQFASPLFFWTAVFFASAAAAYAVSTRIWKSRHSIFWKIQRISGAFLLPAAPAYLIFLSLNQGTTAQAAAAGMQNAFVRIAILAMAAAALYHAGYGLFSILADYLSARPAKTIVTALVVVFIAALTFSACRIIFSL